MENISFLARNAGPVQSNWCAQRKVLATLLMDKQNKMSTCGWMLFATLGFSAFAGGCASAPAAPFDTLKNSQLVAYRLQNYEPPAAPVATAPAGQPGALPVIPGLPPEIQQWAQQALPGLQQLIPPGILPPMPGAAAPVPAPAAQVPRFVDFRILGQTQVLDPELREDLGDLLGDEDNFQAQHSGCMYPELGLSFTSQSGQRNDLLISFSCNQINAVNFTWPHASSGMSPDLVKKLADEFVPKMFPAGGSAPPPSNNGMPMAPAAGGSVNVGTGT
jgi:hypothetical protein